MIFPLLSSAITVKKTGPDVQDRISEGFLASLMCAGNDVQHQNMTALLSGPYADAGSHSMTADNFEKSMLVHAVRRLPKAGWHNDRNQFMQPQKTSTATFINDCVVQSMFSNSNNTAAMKDMAYDGNTHQMENHLFPFAAKEVRKWIISDSDIKLQLTQADDRFASGWPGAGCHHSPNLCWRRRVRCMGVTLRIWPNCEQPDSELTPGTQAGGRCAARWQTGVWIKQGLSQSSLPWTNSKPNC